MGVDTVLVTGAAGAVGHFLIDELRASGLRVIASDLPGSALPRRKKDLLVRAADLTEPGAAARLVRGADAVIHAAAVVDLGRPLDQLEAVNVRATEALYRAAADSEIERFVFLSAGSIYRLDPAGVYREDNPLEANNDYERSKILAEELLLQSSRAAGPQVVVLRPAPVYGPWARNLGAALACLGPILQAYLPVLVGFKNGPRINWVHARDVARAAVHLLGAGQDRQAYNVADDDAIGFGDLLSFSLQTYGLTPSMTLPYPPLGLMRGVLPMLQRSGPLFGGLNRAFQAIWEQVCERHGLERILRPRLDRQALAYGHRDFILLNDKLARTGFRLTYPSIRDGWGPTIAWYQQHRWVPVY